MTAGFDDVLTFWFEDVGQDRWYKKDPALDAEIRDRFLVTYRAAAQGELFVWRHEDEGRLAEIIVLDQFPRNLFREDAASFATDGMALILSQEAVRMEVGPHWGADRKQFLLMPHMHSESLLIQEESVRLFRQPGLEENYDFAVRHKAVIERFGRFPHRNAALGRDNTPEEDTYLAEPGSGF